MFLLSLTATCSVCGVSLKAGQSTYKPLAPDTGERGSFVVGVTLFCSPVPVKRSVRLLYWLSFTSHCFCPRICVIDAEDTQCRPKPLTYTRPRPTWSSCYRW